MVYGWGSGNYGETGTGESNDSNIPKPILIKGNI